MEYIISIESNIINNGIVEPKKIWELLPAKAEMLESNDIVINNGINKIKPSNIDINKYTHHELLIKNLVFLIIDFLCV